MVCLLDDDDDDDDDDLSVFIGDAEFVPFPLPVDGFGVAGFGGGIVWVMSTQILLQLVPGDVRGRTFATEYMMFTLMSAIGAGTVGGALDFGWELGTVIRTMGFLVLIPATLWALWTIRRTRSLAMTPKGPSGPA